MESRIEEIIHTKTSNPKNSLRHRSEKIRRMAKQCKIRKVFALMRTLRSILTVNKSEEQK